MSILDTKGISPRNDDPHATRLYPKAARLTGRKADAPHKPFLLLIIMEMLESGELSENRIPFRDRSKANKSFFTDLIAVFNRGNTTNWQPSLHNPFFHLKTNGFWHLDPPELQSRPAGITPQSLSSQHGCYCSARRASFCFLRNARVSGDIASNVDQHLFFKY